MARWMIKTVGTGNGEMLAMINNHCLSPSLSASVSPMHTTLTPELLKVCQLSESDSVHNSHNDD